MTELNISLSEEALEELARRAARLVVVPDPPPAVEGYLDKRDLADHLCMSPRWIDYRVKEGMPHKLLAGRPRFKASEVDVWLAERGHMVDSRENLNQSHTDANGAAPPQRPAPDTGIGGSDVQAA
jgi:hypothetical protein